MTTATTNGAASATDQPAPPIFQSTPFVAEEVNQAGELSLPPYPVTSFVSAAHDVAAGAAVVFKVLREEQLNDDFRLDAEDPADVEPPLFSPSDREALLGLAMAALTALEADASRLAEWLKERAREQRQSTQH